ncbi:MAG: hypothetical protein AUF79_09470 [Crenarchaeota archaeon 13_1_20CM_2_51_8]|nr:MAG: hypothetical protein AUF79_09470 [Crenarchaeota archaeon 13_1_20CM_2_51_8]
MNNTKLLLVLAILAVSALSSLAKPVKADTNTSATGQPNQSCQAFFTDLLTPQGFNTAGFAIADLHYAGNGQNTQTPANSNAVSQYDVACFQAFLH